MEAGSSTSAAKCMSQCPQTAILALVSVISYKVIFDLTSKVPFTFRYPNERKVPGISSLQILGRRAYVTRA
jgi:hypothetical protein